MFRKLPNFTFLQVKEQDSLKRWLHGKWWAYLFLAFPVLHQQPSFSRMIENHEVFFFTPSSFLLVTPTALTASSTVSHVMFIPSLVTRAVFSLPSNIVLLSVTSLVRTRNSSLVKLGRRFLAGGATIVSSSTWLLRVETRRWCKFVVVAFATAALECWWCPSYFLFYSPLYFI